jgi:hypothetical protein
MLINHWLTIGFPKRLKQVSVIETMRRTGAEKLRHGKTAPQRTGNNRSEAHVC